MLNSSIEHLKRLVVQNPLNRSYVEQLALEYGKLKEWQNASDCFATYLKSHPNDAEAYYNHAYNLRFAAQYELAISQYRKALSLQISQPEEVHVNIAVILSDYLRKDSLAIKELEYALTLNTVYVPALYNLANLYEDSGKINKAINLFETVIKLEPSYIDALSRLAQIKKITNENDTILKRLLSANNVRNIDVSTKINLLFSLGKIYNDCHLYDKAFDYYEQANKLSQKTMPAYLPEQHETLINELISVFTDNFINEHAVINDAEPIFICGMFRSGSTLIEQILAAHPKLKAGGENEFFIRLVESSLAPFPNSMTSANKELFDNIADNYLKDIQNKFETVGQVLDKRPENFLYLGLIKLLFPKARFIFTERYFLDNCLSVYFLRLGQRMNYALKLEHIKHYYQMQEKLMSYWQELFPASIYTIKYDQLVLSPKTEITSLLSFLELEWDDGCLNFHQVKNTVKTASVWQVRQPLYTSSSGRWKNYQQHLTSIKD
jgi:tetratricopeptide (TPR) repeat protein